MKHFFLLPFLFITCIYSNGQVADSSIVPKIKINDFSIVLGGFGDMSGGVSLQNFKTIAPNSILLKRSFDDFTKESGIGAMTGISVLLGLQLRDKSKLKYKNNTLLNIGLGYFSGQGLNYFSNSTKYKRDTIASTQPGENIYIDSMTQYSYNFSYYFQQIRLEGLLSYKLMEDRRFSVYTGIGFSSGFSVNSRTVIQYTKYLSVVSRSSVDKINLVSPLMLLENEDESFKNKMDFGITAYIPMRFDLRIGRKKSLLKRNHIFYELRGGMNMKFINGLDMKKGAVIYHCIGYHLILK